MRKKIGLLYSLSGTISIVGIGQLHASLLAIDEINQTKAIQFEPVVADVQSDPNVAAKEAYRLLKQERVDALVGCYMSSVRNSVIPVLNETGGLLIYPTVYEGEQAHPNIFYLGAVPNQQVEPALSWAIENISSQFILIGSDYVYPRSTNKKAEEYILNAGGQKILEEYFPLGCQQFDPFFEKIKAHPKAHSSVVVFSTIVGTSAVEFYKEYRKNKLPFPIISPITSEREIQLMGVEAATGHICTSSYFQSIETATNKKFTTAFSNHYRNESISREMASSYDAIKLLSLAYDQAKGIAYGKNETEKVRQTLKTLRYEGLQGKVMMNPKFQHLWQWSRLGRIRENGQIEPFWQSPGPVPPEFNTINPDAPQFIFQTKAKPNPTDVIIGRSKQIQSCIQLARVAARTRSNVLITGDTGTGKEVIARLIHAESVRRDYPFIAVNCITVPKDLMASELFGYEEGAFTGANKGGKIGKFEAVSGGSLFLDEIAEMTPEMQASLLRVIEEKEVYRIGGHKPVKLDFRLIAATNREIEEEIHCGTNFRKDLFYRLSVFHIRLPRLCDRRNDIPELTNYFLSRLCLENSVSKSFPSETLDLLTHYSWPGNVRELKNIVERAFYISGDANQITPEYLPKYICHHGFDDSLSSAKREDENTRYFMNISGIDPKTPQEKYSGKPSSAFEKNLLIDDNEKKLIEIAIGKSKYNLTKAAELLGLSRTTLYRKVKKYGISAR